MMRLNKLLKDKDSKFAALIMSIKKLLLCFWTCIYFLVLSDRVFHPDHDGGHGFIQLGHFVGFFIGLS